MQEFSGMDYLRIDIANHMGFDKKLWDERILWTIFHENNLEDFLDEAEEPALYYAAVKAYRKALAGEPIGFPISLDATASGSQILSCLTCDRKAAALCNVIFTGKREDIYTSIYHRMAEKLGEKEKIDREPVKKSVMVSFYGSKAVPKKVFGEGKLYQTFLETMNESAPLAWELNKACLDFWNPKALSYDWIMPDGFSVHIKVMQPQKDIVHFMNAPYEVVYEVNKPTKEGRSLSANMVHSIDGMFVREILRRCKYDPVKIKYLRKLINDYSEDKHNKCLTNFTDFKLVEFISHYKDSGYLSARIFDYLNKDNIKYLDKETIKDIKELLDSLPKKPFDVLCIHDCFRVLPNYGNDIRKQYIIQLASLAKSNMLEYLLKQITGRKISINKGDPEMYKDILNTEYALS